MSLPSPPAPVSSARLATVLTAFLLLLAGSPRALQADSAPAESTVRRSLPLSTFDSTLSGKLGGDGSVDSGAAVLRFFHGDTGEPLDRQRLRYGSGPELWATYYDVVGEASVNLRALAMPRRLKHEERVEVAVQVAFENPFRQSRRSHLRVEVSAGGGDPLQRPLPSLPYVGAPEFSLEGNVLTRDGSAVFYWDPNGVQPQVTVPPAPTGPDDPALVLDFVVELEPREARWAGLHLGGPSAGLAPGGVADEESWRTSLQRYSYERLEEIGTWQSQVRPTYYLNLIGSDQLTRAMHASVHHMRALGDAHLEILTLSDRPYGHPASDNAVEAGMLAVLVEWGMANFAHPRMVDNLEHARERVGDLPVDRRLAFLEGLCRAARQMPGFEHDPLLADVILDLVEAGPVPVWADPAQVRHSMVEVLVRAGMPERTDELPTFTWSEAPEDSTAAHFIAARQALADRDTRRCWSHVATILSRTNPDGMGSLLDGHHAYDAAFSTAIMSLARGLIVDDYGEELVIMPGMVDELLPATNKVQFRQLATVFGMTNFSLYWARRGRVIAGQVVVPGAPAPSKVYIRPPLPYRMRFLQVERGSGHVVPQKDGSLYYDYVPGRPIEFNVGVKRDET